MYSPASVPGMTVGLDVGDRFCDACFLDGEAQVIESSRIRTAPAALEYRFAQIAPVRVVLETGKHSPWISRLLECLGHEVIVANARRVKLISCNAQKSDTVDAEFLARLGRIDPQLLKPIQHRGEHAQLDLAIIRARDVLVRSRTQLVNHVRGVVKSAGGQIPKCSTEAFSRRARRHAPESLRPGLTPLLDQLDFLNAQIRSYDRQIEGLIRERYPEALHLQQIPGVGPITSLAYVLVLEDPARFATSRSVGAFVGLVPRRRQSGSSDPQLHITKTGDGLLRRLLIQSAQYILGPFGPESDLRTAGMRIRECGGKGAKKRSTVAMARKLSVLMHHLWTTGASYEAQHPHSVAA